MHLWLILNSYYSFPKTGILCALRKDYYVFIGGFFLFKNITEDMNLNNR